MSCVDLQYISSDECIGASLPKINGNFAALSAAVCDLSGSVGFGVVDSPTIDLNWNASTRTLSASVIDSSITNAKIAFDGGSFCFRNKIINGGFDIWQRGTTFTGIGAGVFTADRWTTSTSTATLNKNIERQPMSVSDLPYTQAGLAYCVRASYTSGTNSTELVLSQPIELLRTGSAGPFKVGQTYTLSYYARCQSNNDITWSIQSRDGSSSGSNVLQIAGAAQAITGSWTRYSHTFTMTSPNPTNTSVLVAFSNRTTPANTYIDITGVQLEEGPTATPFEHRPIGTELALCQRYYEKSYDLNVVPGTVSSLGSIFGVSATTGAPYTRASFVVTKRANPTTRTYSPNTGAIDRVVNSATAGDVVTTLNTVGTSGFVAGNSTLTNTGISYHFTADAEL